MPNVITNIAGIYKITNLVNGKFYIGSTCNLKRRKGNHFAELNRNKHCNIKLQNAWNKYGEKAFYFEIISTCPKEYLLKLEYWFIKTLSPFYNIIQVQEDYKIKIKSLHKDKSRESVNPRGSLPISVFDINNNLIANFVCLLRCAEFLNTPVSGISKCLKKGRPLNNKYIFKYTKKDNIEYIDNRLTKAKLFTKEGQFLGLFNTYEQLAKHLNVSKDTVYRTINKKTTFLSAKYLIFKEKDKMQVLNQSAERNN